MTLAFKSTKLIKAVKLFKLLKFTKVFLTFGTMTVSILAYSFLWGWQFALGFVIMLFIHEMGHVIALKQKGYQASAPVFVPFFGAAIFVPQINSAEDEAYIGYGGPFVGSVAALALFGLTAILPEKNELLLRVSYTALFLNLFNLIPIRPFDGGRITQAIGEWFKYIGFSALFVLSLMIKEPQMILFWIIILDDLPLNRSVKWKTGVFCTVSMAILMITGYSTQSKWVNLLDIVLAGSITGAMWVAASRLGEKIAEISKHIPLSGRRRVEWFLIYLCTLLVLVFTMHYIGTQIHSVPNVQQIQ